MIGSKGPSDALARSLETLIDPQNTNGVVILHSKMTRAVSVLAAHCTRSVRAANHQLGAKYLLTPASFKMRIQILIRQDPYVAPCSATHGTAISELYTALVLKESSREVSSTTLVRSPLRFATAERVSLK